VIILTPVALKMDRSPSQPHIVCAVNTVFESHDILARLLGMLDNPVDLIWCSAVNKTWHVACGSAQPKALRIGYDNDMQPVQLDHYTGIIRWVARKDKAGHLSGLSKVMFIIDNNRSSREAYSGYNYVMPKVMTLIHSQWPVTCVLLQGLLDFDEAVSALPNSIQQLALLATGYDRMTDDEVIDLDQMNKFCNLSRLKLDMFANIGCGMFCYLSQVLPNLTHLHIGPRTIHWSPLCKQDSWCSISPLYVDRLAMCLPRLKHMTAGVYATRVQTILDILTLKSADLVLQFGCTSYCYPTPVNLVVQEMSGLAHLKIDASGVSKCSFRGLYLRTDKELHFEGVAASGIAVWENTTRDV